MAGNQNGHPVNGLKRRQYLRPIQFTVKELQVVLGVGETKIRQWIDDKRLRSYKINGTVFVHSDDVAEFVNDARKRDDFDLAI